ncbi:MAG: seryl-tRNA synthetase, seryl-tRNA synthetase [Candidatus Parcubacteria bacterium]|jgi:seryl-tRNA synthetase
MLDIKFIRENSDLIKDAARKKHINFEVDALIKKDDERRTLLTEVEAQRKEQNDATAKISGGADASVREALIAQMKTLKEELQKKEEKLKEITKEWQLLMVQVPNIPDMSVPEGVSDAENQEVRTWGEKTSFAFTPKNHIEIMESLDMLDTERGAKVAGFRGYFLKNAGAELYMAVTQFVWSHFIKKGFSPMVVPSLLRREPFIGTGYLPQSEEDLYKTQDGEYLAGTAEVGTMGYYMDEVLDRTKLPLKFISISQCFRREAGSHGKDTKGIMRVHEFTKVEQVVLCEADHQMSVKFHEELTGNAEEVLQALGVPYRVVVNCGGDLGLGQVKKYDIESWVPSEKTYRETHSASYFHDFQTRRLNIRYKDTDGKLKFVHSLNNTAVAVPRILISIIENNQKEDGSIAVPPVLIPFLGRDTISS